MADAQRVEIGFEGGQVVSARLAEDDLKDLREQFGKVALICIESGEHHIGFGPGV